MEEMSSRRRVCRPFGRTLGNSNNSRDWRDECAKEITKAGNVAQRSAIRARFESSILWSGRGRRMYVCMYVDREGGHRSVGRLIHGGVDPKLGWVASEIIR